MSTGLALVNELRPGERCRFGQSFPEQGGVYTRPFPVQAPGRTDIGSQVPGYELLPIDASVSVYLVKKLIVREHLG